MSAPRQPLNPIEQNELLQELTTLLVPALPEGWGQLVIEYRLLGRHVAGAVGVRNAGGPLVAWEPPTEAWRFLSRLRTGMYQPGVGTWFSARFTIDPPDQFSISYNWQNEPEWGASPPPPEAYQEELRRFPRGENNIPAWLQAHLGATGN